MTATSIIVEMDNLRSAEVARTTALLDELRRQARTLADRYPLEIRLVHDPLEVPAQALDALIAADADPYPPIERLEVRDARYYDLKNAGAQAARGEILVFIDSDVIPEPGFLEALLAPFADPEVEIAGGTAYVDTRDNLFEEAFAAFWLYPARTPDGPPERAADFYPNCVAFRRDTFARFPFPTTPTYRRGGEILSRTLRQANVPIWRVPMARARHPAPMSLRAALVRALQEGHDRFQDKLAARRRATGGPLGAVRGLQRSLGDAGRRVHQSRPESARRLPARLPIMAIATSYELAVRLGFVMTALDRRLVPTLTGHP